MGVVDVLSMMLAISSLALLPGLVLLIVFGDDMIDSMVRAIRRARARYRRRYGPPEPDGPPLQQIADDLHRLGVARVSVARLGVAEGSLRHQAITRAYDRRLVQACLALGLEHHLGDLGDLDGIDIELERLRIEGALLEAGFVLSSVDTGLDIDGRQDR